MNTETTDSPSEYEASSTGPDLVAVLATLASTILPARARGTGHPSARSAVNLPDVGRDPADGDPNGGTKSHGCPTTGGMAPTSPSPTCKSMNAPSLTRLPLSSNISRRNGSPVSLSS